MSALVVFLVIVGVVLFGLYLLYCSVIKKKNKVKEAESSINVQLKKRFDLIPNILKIANKFMEHEKGLLEEIVKLRNQATTLSNSTEDLKQKMAVNGEINSKMGQLMVAVENYPQLKSDQTMVSAMQTFNEVEEHIAAARRFYNSAVNELNNAVEIFPSSIIAAMLGIKAQEFFNEIEEVEKKGINASDFLK